MTKKLEDISEGDKVWVGDKRNPRNHLQLVTKLTRTQIVLNGDDRYHRDNLRRVGTGGLYLRLITAIATPEECQQWDAERADEAREAEARREKTAERHGKRAELNALFSSEHAHVHESDDDLAGEWQVTLYGSEDEVRRLAALLAAPLA
jgi:hypothetical protein